MSSNNSLYHSSPCLKKVLSEQFLHQFKQKTDIDQIRLKLKELQVRRGKGAQDDQDGSGFLTGATPNKTQNIDCKIKATTAAKGQQSKLGAAGNAKGAQGVQLQSLRRALRLAGGRFSGRLPECFVLFYWPVRLGRSFRWALPPEKP